MGLRHLPVDEPRRLGDLIENRPGQVSSMGLASGGALDMTLLAFDGLESVSEEGYLGDTLYLVVDGTMRVVMDGRSLVLGAGEVLMVPSGTLHAVEGVSDFKVLQITVP